MNKAFLNNLAKIKTFSFQYMYEQIMPEKLYQCQVQLCYLKIDINFDWIVFHLGLSSYAGLPTVMTIFLFLSTETSI